MVAVQRSECKRFCFVRLSEGPWPCSSAASYMQWSEFYGFKASRAAKASVSLHLADLAQHCSSLATRLASHRPRTAHSPLSWHVARVVSRRDNAPKYSKLEIPQGQARASYPSQVRQESTRDAMLSLRRDTLSQAARARRDAANRRSLVLGWRHRLRRPRRVERGVGLASSWKSNRRASESATRQPPRHRAWRGASRQSATTRAGGTSVHTWGRTTTATASASPTKERGTRASCSRCTVRSCSLVLQVMVRSLAGNRGELLVVDGCVEIKVQ